MQFSTTLQKQLLFKSFILMKRQIVHVNQITLAAINGRSFCQLMSVHHHKFTIRLCFGLKKN